MSLSYIATYEQVSHQRRPRNKKFEMKSWNSITIFLVRSLCNIVFLIKILLTKLYLVSKIRSAWTSLQFIEIEFHWASNVRVRTHIELLEHQFFKHKLEFRNEFLKFWLAYFKFYWIGVSQKYKSLNSNFIEVFEFPELIQALLVFGQVCQFHTFSVHFLSLFHNKEKQFFVTQVFLIGEQKRKFKIWHILKNSKKQREGVGFLLQLCSLRLLLLRMKIFEKKTLFPSFSRELYISQKSHL